MNSARRERIPTGRSNLNSACNTARSSTLDIVYNTARCNSNDNNNSNDSYTMRPALGKSRYPTVPPSNYNAFNPKASRQTCSNEWLVKSKQVDSLDTIDLKTILDDDENVLKRELLQPFISRNKDRLWKYDINYLDKTPRTVTDDIIREADKNFLGLLRNKLIKVEKRLALSSSDQALRCLTFKQNILNDSNSSSTNLGSSCSNIGTIQYNYQAPTEDNFPHHTKINRRGTNHTVEYGNFSKLNAFLQANKGGLNR